MENNNKIELCLLLELNLFVVPVTAVSIVVPVITGTYINEFS
jgi:hypothetical protein